MILASPHADPRSDARLLADAGHDPAAFAELYERHALSVYRWVDRRMGWLAADLTAETFTRAWLHCGQFRDERGGSALPWLLGIAGRLIVDAARRDQVETRARARLGLRTEIVTPGDHGEIDRRLSPRHVLAQRLAELPVHERDALDLRIIEELGYDEVARRLNIRPAAARLRVSRALGRLRQTVPEEE
jgi:RNA polymerase sigma factor (sigma-70 family)